MDTSNSLGEATERLARARRIDESWRDQAARSLDAMHERALKAEARVEELEAGGVWISDDEMRVLQYVVNNDIEEKEERVIEAIVDRWEPKP